MNHFRIHAGGKCHWLRQCLGRVTIRLEALAEPEADTKTPSRDRLPQRYCPDSTAAEYPKTSADRKGQFGEVLSD
jgi:hypothetical protein